MKWFGSRTLAGTGIIAAVIAAAILSAPLSAQVVGGGGAGGGKGGVAHPKREELDQRFRERTAALVRRRLKLSDEQMSRLQAANQQLDRERVALVAEEGAARKALRAELLARDAANEQKVASLLDQLIRLQRQRVDMMANEQRELAKFLTPTQRAKYLGLQNQLRARMDELRKPRGAASGGARRVPPGGARRTPPTTLPRARRNFR
jgi:Spy/CpxP family protein refolding chaperone